MVGKRGNRGRFVIVYFIGVADNKKDHGRTTAMRKKKNGRKKRSPISRRQSLSNKSVIGRWRQTIQRVAQEVKAKGTRLQSGESTRVKIRNGFGGRRHTGPLSATLRDQAEGSGRI